MSFINLQERFVAAEQQSEPRKAQQAGTARIAPMTGAAR
jgi:hypothetical protein